jgi:L-fuconolactonase
MRIDAHQHFWIYSQSQYGWIGESMATLRRDFLPEDLEPELQQAGFHGCIAVQARQTNEETHWLLQLALKSPLIRGVVGWVDLRSPRLDSELQALANQPKVVGVRHIVQDEPDDRFLLQSEFLRGVALLKEYDLAYDILIYEKHLPVAVEFVRQFPQQRFVLDHLAKPRIKEKLIGPWAEGIRALAAFPNVYCKLSGLVTEADWQNWKPEDFTLYLDVAMECFGSDRLMIGSDWPVCTVAASYSRAMGAVIQYLNRFPEGVRQKVLGENAQRFYKLSVAGNLRSAQEGGSF